MNPDTAADKWTVYSASQNLPAVLNDPNRGKQVTFFTRTWGDSFVEGADVGTSSFLPDITPAHFSTYLLTYSRKQRRHLRLSQAKLDASRSRTKSETTTTVHVVDIHTIPPVFLQPELPLNDPAIFNVLFKNGSKGSQLLADRRALQEQYSLYLDYVEEQIAMQVAQKSGAFFHAMTSHDTIMEQMGSACKQVRHLRTRIHTIDRMLAKDSLRLLGLARARVNRLKLLYMLKLIATVLQTQPTIQLLLNTSDYVAALELIAGTQEVLARELAGVTSLRHLPSQLKEMSKLIDKMLSSEFERYAVADLHRPLDVRGLLEPERLTSLVAGLLRLGNVKFLDVYRQEALVATQTILKQLLIEQLATVEDDVEHCLTGSGEATPTLDSEHWLGALSLAGHALIELMRRVRAVHDVVKQTADVDFGVDDCWMNETEYKRVLAKLSDLLNYICDYFNERMATLIGTQTDRQPINAAQINELAKIVANFSDVCEQLCQRRSAKLNAEFKIQASKYVNAFHAQRKHNLTLLLHAESWTAAQVPLEFQLLADRLAADKPMQSLPGTPPLEANGTATTVWGGGAKRPADFLRVGGAEYVTVGTVLILLRLVSEYCVCAYDLPLLAPVIGRNLAELLRTFNAHAYQLVLEAGALRPGEGEKTITSTNLALTSRALQLVLWWVPHVRAHFGAVTEDSLVSLDVVERDVEDHVRKLEAKIVSIMNYLLGKQLREWEAKPPIPSKTFRMISMHIVTLHRAVGAVLPADQVTAIYELVHRNFKGKLREYVLRMNIQNNGGPQHGVVTSEILFYVETLRNLKVLPDKCLSDKAMDDIWVR